MIISVITCICNPFCIILFYLLCYSISGGVDHFARDEPESYEICRDVLLSLNLPRDVIYDAASAGYAEPLYDSNELSGLVSAGDPNPHQVSV